MAIQQTLEAALQHHQAGRLADAQALYQFVLAEQPNHPDALHLLGVLGSQAGQHAAAANLIRQAIALNPSAPHYHDNLGVALAAAGETEAAIAAHRKAIALKADFAEAHNHLGNALKAAGLGGEAVGSFRKSVQIRPGYAEAHYNLGVCLTSLERYGEAEVAYRNAIAANPGYVDAHNNLGACLYDQGRFDEALVVYRHALSLQPNHVDAHNNMGNAYRAKGELSEAIKWFGKTLELDPAYALAHWNYGLVLLIQGNYERGWVEYDWRWKVKSFDLRNDLTRPTWDGGPLNGKTILIFAEQGIGDAVQFIRYLPEVVNRGGKIILLCHVHTHRLFKNLPYVSQLVGLDEPLPMHDVQFPLMSLPRIMGTTVNSIPAPIGYLKADAALAAAWRGRIPADGRMKVGLCWANRPNPADRCPEAEVWGPLAEVKGVCFCSLQKPIIGSMLPVPPPRLELLDWSADLKDFADTAAVIANMDLVISVDTAVAHLAGAMGKPTWVPLKFMPDWRWLLERRDSPWYPTMKLFRQPRLGDWATPVGEVVGALKGMR